MAVASLFDGDLIAGVVFIAIGSANNRKVLPLPDAADKAADAARQEPPIVRLPISVSALSRSLGLPYETTRRHVARLVAQGMCERTSQGILAKDETLHSERLIQVFKKSNADVRWFICALRKGGMDIDHIR